MRFSVCIPTYNRAHTIKKPLDSLLKQTCNDFEVLVIDDGSDDNTEEIVSEYMDSLDICYIKKKNGGKHTALNVGLKTAKGDLFLILDSDDELNECALEKMNSIWEANRDERICGIMCRCSSGGQFIGLPFKENQKHMSYIEFHFGVNGGKYGDCCECIRTDIISRYCWPELSDTKFVPENYVTDQIGLKYKLLCSNEVVMDKIYHEQDGITKNIHMYRKKNYLGYLFNYISKIDDIFPNAKDITITAKFRVWCGYWQMVSYDENRTQYRCNKITILGKIAWWMCKLTKRI